MPDLVSEPLAVGLATDEEGVLVVGGRVCDQVGSPAPRAPGGGDAVRVEGIADVVGVEAPRREADRGPERARLVAAAVEKAGLTTLNEGQQVQYEVVANRGKTSAENLKVG